jgi:SAM-dependent methyltransferase
MAALPLGDAIADVVISNGAINLAPDKAAVLGEAFRVLRPGGRLQLADMVRRGLDCGEGGDGSESWANCVSGTLAPECLLQILSEAGFSHVGLEAFTGYKTADNTEGAMIRALRPLP